MSKRGGMTALEAAYLMSTIGLLVIMVAIFFVSVTRVD